MQWNRREAEQGVSQEWQLFFSFRIRVYDVLGSVSCVSPNLASKKRLYSGITIGKLYEKWHTIRVSLSRSFCFSQQSILFNSQALHNCLVHTAISNWSRASATYAIFSKPFRCLRFTPLQGNSSRRFLNLARSWLAAIEKERFSGFAWVSHSLIVGLLERGLLRIVFIISRLLI